MQSFEQKPIPHFFLCCAPAIVERWYCLDPRHYLIEVEPLQSLNKSSITSMDVETGNSPAGGVPLEAVGEINRAHGHDEDEPVDPGAGRIVLQGPEAWQPQLYPARRARVRKNGDRQARAYRCIWGCPGSQ